MQQNILNFAKLLCCEEAFLAVHGWYLIEVERVFSDDVSLVCFVEDCLDLSQTSHPSIVCYSTEVHPSVVSRDKVVVDVGEQHCMSELLDCAQKP